MMLTKEDIDHLQHLELEVLLISSPSNPLGIVISESVMQELVCFSQKYSVALIVDETYIGLEINGDRSFLDIVKSKENLVIIRSMSKLFRAPGIRVGFVISNDQLIKRLHNVARNMYLVPSTLSQHVAIDLIDRGTKDWHLKGNLNNLEKLLEFSYKNTDLFIVKPDISFFCSFQIKKKNGSIFSCKEIHKITGLILRDTSDFGLNDYYRMNLCIPELEMDNVILRLQYLLEEYGGV